MTPRERDPAFEAWVAEARAVPVGRAVARVGGLKRAGKQVQGPCPACGGRDRFWINPARDKWGCRNCQTGGKGALSLLMHVPGARFLDVCAELAGPAPKKLAAESAEDRAKRQAERDAAAKRREDEAAARAAAEEAEMERQRGKARGLVRSARSTQQDDAVWRYWEIRRLGNPFYAYDIRFEPAMSYWAEAGELPDGHVRHQVIHTGPAMVAAARDAAGTIVGCHITWLHPALASPLALGDDLAQVRASKGKAVIVHPETSEIMPAKKMRGQTWGALIRLTEPRPFMVAGEGIETTATALAAFGGRPDVGAAAGMSLGHLSAIPIHPGSVWMFIGDGDSEPKATRAALEAACTHALRSGAARTLIAMAPDGRDLNDLVLG